VREKSPYILLAELQRMPLAVKQDESPDPLNVCLLSAKAVPPNPNRLSNQIE
jgi:hypothetical protein